jgi:hypothetical protein
MRLARFWINPLERKAKPSAVAGKCVIVDNHANTGPILTDLGDLCRVSLSCHRAIAFLVMPDVVFLNAKRRQIEFAFVPNLLRSVEEAIVDDSSDIE